MNPPTKRLLALAGSVVAGLFGVIMLASPAQAHHPIIKGWAYCQADGQYKITWNVANGNWFGRFMKLDVVDSTPDTAFTNITVGKWLDPNGSVTDTQFVPGTTTTATLYVNAKWYQTKDANASVKVEEHATGTVTLKGTCKAKPNPSATFTDACDGSVGVHLVNPNTFTRTFRIQGTNVDKTVEVTAQQKETDVPVTAGAGKITVSVKQGNNTWAPVDSHDGWVRPDCPKPEVASQSNCTEFSVAVTNAKGNLPFSVKITYGSQTIEPEWTEVKTGETKNFKFLAGGATTAKIEFTNDWPSQTVNYVTPATCETLPKTGSSTTTLIASGTGLAMLGGLAFFFARRRMAQLRKLASN